MKSLYTLKPGGWPPFIVVASSGHGQLSAVHVIVDASAIAAGTPVTTHFGSHEGSGTRADVKNKQR